MNKISLLEIKNILGEETEKYFNALKEAELEVARSAVENEQNTHEK